MTSIFQWPVTQVTGVKATIHGTMQNSAASTFNQLQRPSQPFNLRWVSTKGLHPNVLLLCPSHLNIPVYPSELSSPWKTSLYLVFALVKTIKVPSGALSPTHFQYLENTSSLPLTSSLSLSFYPAPLPVSQEKSLTQRVLGFAVKAIQRHSKLQLLVLPHIFVP